MEYLWPRMGELRKAAPVKHLIHGDRRSAKSWLTKRGQRVDRRHWGANDEQSKIHNRGCGEKRSCSLASFGQGLMITAGAVVTAV